MDRCGFLSRSAIRRDGCGAAGEGFLTDGFCPWTADGARRSPIRLISEPRPDREPVEGAAARFSADDPIGLPMRERSGFVVSGVLAGPVEELCGICRCGVVLDRVSCRRDVIRSKIELREELLLCERLGEDARGVELGVLFVPIRLPILSVPLRPELPL